MNHVSAPEVSVGGVHVRPFASMDDAVGAVFDAKGQLTTGFAVAVNPEKVILSQENPKVLEHLRSATVRFADGIGVVLAMRARGAHGTRIAGCELWEHVMERAAKHMTPVFLIGAKPETLARAQEKLLSRHPGLKIVGSQHGYFKPEEKQRLLDQVAASGAQVVTVAMGSPRQEELIAELRKHHPNAFYMGVGGTYDVFVGTVRRAPALARRLHLEWFFRLANEPARIWRQRRLATFALRLVTGRL
jgi:UDP-N-acetyl-D-mannosaminouronate:lipid I N-acetyl-D-mannosaminouronosyltransferase